MKRALITGITGQDGSYLAELLLGKGYEVHGIVRRVAIEDSERRLWRIRHILDRVTLHGASLESFPSIIRVVDKVNPDECYHLAAQSYVPYAFEDEFSTINTNINGTHFVLNALKERTPRCRFYFAASSEMFGNAEEPPQDMLTPLNPLSSYGITKLAGFHLTRKYREAHGLYALSGILFNHESPRRGMEFVSRKITNTAARIKLGLADELRLGNLDARRDWGYALEYVEAMFRMLQRDDPEDYLIATGATHSVRELVDVAFDYVGLDSRDHVVVDEKLYRPSEIYELRGDPEEAERKLGWEPRISFEELIRMMVDADLAELQHQTPHSMSGGGMS